MVSLTIFFFENSVQTPEKKCNYIHYASSKNAPSITELRIIKTTVVLAMSKIVTVLKQDQYQDGPVTREINSRLCLQDQDRNKTITTRLLRVSIFINNFSLLQKNTLGTTISS